MPRPLELKFDHGDDAYIVLKDLPGETFTVEGTALSQDFLLDTTASGQFVTYLDTLLESEGQVTEDLTYEELTKRFHVKQWGLKAGREEIASLRSQ